MSTHTPGPWIAHVGNYTEVRTSDNRRIADLHGGAEKPSGGIDADARLIAAAPDLLEVLGDLINLGSLRNIAHPGPALARARQLHHDLTRATGSDVTA